MSELHFKEDEGGRKRKNGGTYSDPCGFRLLPCQSCESWWESRWGRRGWKTWVRNTFVKIPIWYFFAQVLHSWQWRVHNTCLQCNFNPECRDSGPVHPCAWGPGPPTFWPLPGKPLWGRVYRQRLWIPIWLLWALIWIRSYNQKLVCQIKFHKGISPRYHFCLLSGGDPYAEFARRNGAESVAPVIEALRKGKKKYEDEN